MLSYRGKPTWLGRLLWGRYANLNAILYTLERTLNRIKYVQTQNLIGVCQLSEALDRLTNEVTENASVVDSAIILISDLASQIRDNIGDDGALNALADDLDVKTAALASAIAAHTVAEEPVLDEVVEDDTPEENL